VLLAPHSSLSMIHVGAVVLVVLAHSLRVSRAFDVETRYLERAVRAQIEAGARAAASCPALIVAHSTSSVRFVIHDKIRSQL
jgi:hypothetical protein